MRPVLLADEEAEEGAALERVVVADGSLQHGVAGFDGVEDGADGDGRGDFKGDFAFDLRKVAEVVGELDADGICSGHGFLGSFLSYPFSV